MADTFRMLFEGLRDAATQMMLAQSALVQAGEAALAAHEDDIDLRETVARLESLVLAQGTELRAIRTDIAALRARLDGPDHRLEEGK